MSSGSHGGSSQSSNPWAAQQPYLKSLYARADALSTGQQPTMYPGQLVAPQDPSTVAGLNQISQQGLAGSPLTRSAQDVNLATTRGDFLGGPGANPYLDPIYQHAAGLIGQNYNRVVAPQIAGTFGSAGRFGSGAHQAAIGAAGQQLATQLGDTATQLYGGNYQAERGRMMDASSQSIPLANQDFFSAQQAVGAGQTNQEFQQKLISEAAARHDFGQNQPYDALARYKGLLGDAVSVSRGSSSDVKNWGLK